jgi:hypothetical protein
MSSAMIRMPVDTRMGTRTDTDGGTEGTPPSSGTVGGTGRRGSAESTAPARLESAEVTVPS